MIAQCFVVRLPVPGQYLNDNGLDSFAKEALSPFRRPRDQQVRLHNLHIVANNGFLQSISVVTVNL
jgi:hypothetical protein